MSFLKHHSFFLILLVASSLKLSLSENILFFNGLSSHSHLVAFEPLAHKLADRGHKLTILSPMISEKKHPNITYFCPESLRISQESINVIGESAVSARMKSKYNDYFLQTTEAWDMTVEMCRTLITAPDFKKWLDSSSFSLFVIDAFQRECALPIAYKMGAKTILFQPSTLFYGDHDTFGLPLDSSFSIPFATQHWFLPDSFVFEIESLSWFYFRQSSFLPKFDKLVRKELSDKSVKNGIIPSLAQLEKKVSLLFVNQFFTAEYARSLPNFVVPVGGLHCKESKGISNKEIREFVEDSEAFIFISFGSLLKVSALSLDKQKIFFDTFASFPKIKFLWKWDDETPKFLPKNILMLKWFPQQDVLAHPKCKGFISQGGMMSYQQSMFHGVPVIILPGGGDQVFNARLAQNTGFGIHLEFSELTVSIFKGAIGELLKNKKYKKKAEELSRLFKDRPISAVDSGLYWTEYVLRYDEDHLDHLKSPMMHQYWWQRRVLHVWVTIILLIVLGIRTIVKGIFGFFRVSAKVSLNKKGNSSSDKKKQ